MQHNLTETLVMDKAANVRFTDDGYMVAAPRIARTGIQLYYGRELGVTGADALKVFKVYRPEDQVFDKSAMASLAYKPITNDHPPVQVQSGNWKDYAVGSIGGEIARDGEFIRVPTVLMDGSAIQRYKDGVAELSVGYTCDIEMNAGQTADGETYDAIQKNIRANHLAVVKSARGGAALRIGDSAGCAVDRATVFSAAGAIAAGKLNMSDAIGDTGQGLAKANDGKIEYPILKDGVVYVQGLSAARTNAKVIGDAEALSVIDNLLSLIDRSKSDHSSAPRAESTTPMKVITVDGISCQVADGNDGEIILRHISKLSDSVATLTKDATMSAEEIGKLKTAITAKDAELVTVNAAKDAEIATLKQKVADGALTPAKLDTLVKDRALMLGKAKAVLGDKLIVADKTDGEIRRQVVDAKMGERAKGWSDEQITIGFDTLTVDVKVDAPQPAAGFQDMRSVIADGSAGDARAQAEKTIAARDARLVDSWKGPQHKVA